MAGLELRQIAVHHRARRNEKLSPSGNFCNPCKALSYVPHLGPGLFEECIRGSVKYFQRVYAPSGDSKWHADSLDQWLAGTNNGLKQLDV